MKFLRNIFDRKNDVDQIISKICKNKKIKKKSDIFLYFDWPFGSYIFDELLKEKTNLQLDKFSLFEIFDVHDRRDLMVLYEQDLQTYCQTICNFIVEHYPDGIQGFLITHDWLPAHQVVVKIFQKLGVQTVLITHEGVFQNRNLFYDSKAPICDIALVWGRLHKEIFIERGYSSEKIFEVGSIKLNKMKNFSFNVDKDKFFSITNLHADKKTILYCCQLCDLQWGCQENALNHQKKQIEDIVMLCNENEYNCIIRNSPALPMRVLPDDFVSYLSKYDNVFIDGYDLDNTAKSQYKVSIEDSLFYSDLVIGMNTTVQLEAVLIHKPAIIMQYFDFDAVWGRVLGLPIAKSKKDLALLVQHLINVDRFNIDQDLREHFEISYGYSDNPDFSPIDNIYNILRSV